MHKLIVMAVTVVLLSACSAQKHRYVPRVLTTDPTSFTALNGVNVRGPVALLNGQQEDAEMLLGEKGVNEYYGSLKDLTETVVITAGRELAKRQISTASDAATSLSIRVTSAASTSSLLDVEAKLELEVVAGSGVTRRIKVTNKTPGSVLRAYNGAVSLAVIEILSDAAILGYLAGS